VSKAKIATTLLCMLALAGCATPYSEVPKAKNFSASSQEKLQAASHWGLITNDLYKKLQAKMGDKVEKSQRLYVSSKDNSPFNQAVVAELISELVADGYLVAKNPENTTKIDIDTQVLEFSPSRLKPVASGVPTLIVAGLWTLTESGVAVTTAGVASAVVIAKDASNYFGSETAAGSTPKTEIIVNIGVSNADNYIAVSRGTYYVTDTDKWLYQAALTKTFSVKGGN
jgi:hypothetical protein